tara:strand:- start:2139 stop:2927 length:789 start_codon:yes stop_codon:yes gene_type:complete
MATIDKVTGTTWTSIVSMSGITASSIVSIDGQTAPASGITLTDITESYGSTNLSTTEAITIDLPSTAGSGDMVLMMFTMDYAGSADRLATPTGWTIVNSGGWGSGVSDAWVYMFWREFDGTEGSSVDIYATSDLRRIGYVAWTTIMSNVNTTTPISAVGSPAIASSGTTVTAPAVTAAHDGVFICIVSQDRDTGDPFSYSNSSFTLTAGGEGDSTGGGTTGKGVSSGWVYADITSSTSTSTTVVTASVSDGKVAGQFVLRQA